MRVGKETVYTVTMSTSEAAKLARSLGRVLTSIDKLPIETREWHVDLGDIDQLLALKTAITITTERGASEV